MPPAHIQPKEWFVVRSKPRKEECAVRHLTRRGVEVFFPRILEPIGLGNDWTTVPLFPGYLFVEIVLLNDFHQIIWTPGVKGFVAFGEVPTAIQSRVVQFLQHEAGPDGVIRPARRFHKGDRVRIKRGPFAGLIGHRHHRKTMSRTRSHPRPDGFPPSGNRGRSPSNGNRSRVTSRSPRRFTFSATRERFVREFRKL
jgi:transcriptional antiterminator RfaH